YYFKLHHYHPLMCMSFLLVGNYIMLSLLVLEHQRATASLNLLAMENSLCFLDFMFYFRHFLIKFKGRLCSTLESFLYILRDLSRIFIIYRMFVCRPKVHSKSSYLNFRDNNFHSANRFYWILNNHVIRSITTFFLMVDIIFFFDN